MAHLVLQPSQLGVADQIAAGITPGFLHRGEHQLLGDKGCQYGSQGSSKGRDGGGVRRKGSSNLGGVSNKLSGVRKNRRNPSSYGCSTGVFQLLIPTRQPGFEHMQGQNLTEIE